MKPGFIALFHGEGDGGADALRQRCVDAPAVACVDGGQQQKMVVGEFVQEIVFVAVVLLAAVRNLQQLTMVGWGEASDET